MSSNNSGNTKYGYVAVAISALLFSAKSIFIKMCYSHGVTPIVLMTLRTGFALPFFLGMALFPWFSRAPKPKTVSRIDSIAILGLGLLGYYVASVLDIVGLLYVSAGTERLILYVYPSLVVMLSAWFFGKPIPRNLLVPLLLSYVGIALSFGGELAKASGGRPLLGGGLIFLSALSYALFLVGHGRMVHRIGPQRLGAYAMLSASAAVMIHFVMTQRLSALSQPTNVYVLAGLTAVFCTVVPVYLFGYGVQLIGSGRAAIVSSLGPVSTFVLASVLLGEGTGILQVTGLGLVLLGSLSLVGGGERTWMRRLYLMGLEIAAPRKSGPGA